MKKSTGFLAAIAVVVVAYVGATWYVGKQARQTIEYAVEQANGRMARAGVARALMAQPMAHSAKLTVAEYRRHVFSSDIVYSLQLQDDKGQTHEFLLGDHLQHGPFPLNAVLAGKLAPMLAFSQTRLLPSAATQGWFDSLDGQHPLTGVTHVGFGGSATSDWVFKPVNVVEQDEVLKFSGGVVQAVFDNNFTDSSVVGGFDLIDYSNRSGDARFLAKDISFQYENKSEDNAAHMSSTSRVAHLGLELADQEPLTLQGVAMRVSSDQAGDLLGGAVHYDFGRIQSGSIDLGSFSLEAKGRDVSMSALSELTSVYEALSDRHGPDNTYWQLSSSEAVQLQEKALAVLATNPVLAIDPVVWKNNQGESRAKLTLELTRPAQVEGVVSIDMLMQQMLHALELELSIDKAMFVEAMVRLQGVANKTEAAALYDEFANRLHTFGLVSATDPAAVAKIVYRDSQVDVNGKVMAAPQFLQRALLVFLM